jgi:adenine deaminase
MYVMVREGAAAKNLKELMKVVNEVNSHRFLLCTDDKHLDQLMDEGSIDHSIRLAVSLGYNPLMMIQMASINAATCYGLKSKGAVAPGYDADILILDDLNNFKIREVYKNGELVVQNGAYIGPKLYPNCDTFTLRNSVRLKPLVGNDFLLPLRHTKANIIKVNPDSLYTTHIVDDVLTSAGLFNVCLERDYLKLAVIERHLMTGNIGLGIVNGLGLKAGAVAVTIAHDSHNVICVGCNDSDMAICVNELKRIEGGIVIAANGHILATLALPIGGLMTDQPVEKTRSNLNKLNLALELLGFDGSFDFLLALAFLSLPVIPQLKLTSNGLFHFSSFNYLGINVD